MAPTRFQIAGFPLTKPRSPLKMTRQGPVLPRLKVTAAGPAAAAGGFNTGRGAAGRPADIDHNKRRHTVVNHLPNTARGGGGGEPARPPPPYYSSRRTSRLHAVSARAVAGGKAASSSQPTADDPMTAAVVLQKHSHELTPFEESEILAYPEIYFVGKTSKKTRGIPQGSRNNGYDDERGDYRIVPHDHIAYRYEVVDVLGKGSFGQVVKVLDHKSGTYQALKIIRNKKRFHHQALVEVRILEFCSTNSAGHDNGIVQMFESLTFRNHLCITFELLSLNLYEFIKSVNFRGLSLNLIRRIAVQLLTSLRFLKQNSIIHSDLKPENILLRNPNKSFVSLIDFGSSCFENERIYTYIQSRFYRSPEVLLGNPYGGAIDIWSLGCILVELYTGMPIFQGENETEQLACIMEIMGIPPTHIYESSPRRKVFFDSNLRPRPVKSAQGKLYTAGSKDLAATMRCSDRRFVDFVARCLEWDPRYRVTPQDALRHPFILQGRGGSHLKGFSDESVLLPVIGVVAPGKIN